MLAVAALLLMGTAHAFHTPYHLEITREALEHVGGFDEATKLAIIEGNRETDADKQLFFTPAAHFDNEAFAAGSQRLREKFVEALRALQDCNRRAALRAIGTSLHAIQDFYAHSNYLELRGDDPTKIDLFRLQDPPAGAVCRAGTSSALTSGYYPDKPRVAGKCSHGELAKDDEHAGDRYRRARAMAVVASIRYLERFQAAIRSRHRDADGALRYLKDHWAVPASGSTCYLSPECPGPNAGMMPVIEAVERDFLDPASRAAR